MGRLSEYDDVEREVAEPTRFTTQPDSDLTIHRRFLEIRRQLMIQKWNLWQKRHELLSK